jgi:hypothetical protein
MVENSRSLLCTCRYYILYYLEYYKNIVTLRAHINQTFSVFRIKWLTTLCSVKGDLFYETQFVNDKLNLGLGAAQYGYKAS